MDISANIEKVFGEELAKLYSEQIGEEELKEAAQKAYDSISKHPYNYGNYNKSPLEEAIEKVFIKKVSEAFTEILSTQQSKEDIRQEAELIIEEAKKVAHEKLVERISDGICNGASYSIDTQMLCGAINMAINRMSNR